MKKLLLLLLAIFMVACSPKVQEPKTSEELIETLKDTKATYLEGEIFYNIFPISFADGDGNRYGDFQGIIKSLDYLKEMGVKGLWLNPIHPSSSYHKYDVLDYYEIDEQFGTMEDFEQLLEEVHNRDMVLIMDIVFNHSSSAHPWFIEDMKGEGHNNWYIQADTKEEIESANKSAWYSKYNKWYFGSFWSEMPEYNLENPEVRAEFKKILKFWMDKGVDGFRYDAAKHAYDPNEYAPGTRTREKNLQFWLELQEYVKSVNHEVYTIAEVWENEQSRSYYKEAFDGTFNFDIGESTINALRNQRFADLIANYVKGQQYFKDSNDFMDGIFLTNHDQNRIGSVLGGFIPNLKVAASILLTMPGNPYIYYGEELGYLGAKPDERIREPYKWDGYNDIKTPSWEDIQLNRDTMNVQAQIDDSNSLLNHYRVWGQFRANSETLKTGLFSHLNTGDNRLLGYTRVSDNETLAIYHNLSHEPLTIDLEGEILLSNGNNTLTSLEPHGSMIIRLP